MADSMAVVKRFLILAAAMPATLLADPPPAEPVPAYRPYCAMPGTRPVFVAPMGEPFRAEPGAAYPAAAWLAGADRDGDGAVDRVEFVRDADRFFKTLDTNHDGRLTPEEIDAYERDVAPEIALYGHRGGAFDPPAGRPRNGESGYGGPMGAGRYAWLNIPEPVAAADLDITRVIDARTFARAAGLRFDQLAPQGRLLLARMPRTPQQMALDGSCQKRPKPRKPRRGEMPGDEGDQPDRAPAGGAPPP